MTTNSDGYIEYNAKDTKHAGAVDVVKEELNFLDDRRNTVAENLSGIALSGGGIRAASFSLGVIQSLAKHNKLKMFDYLSTVSGGSYLGGSLSWLWLDKWKEGETCTREFGTDDNNFPYGIGERYSNKDEAMGRDQASLMRHLRQNGKYLTPGDGVTALSLLSVVLRGLLIGFVALIVLSSLFFHFIRNTDFTVFGSPVVTYLIPATLLCLILYVLCLLLNPILSLLFNSEKNADTAYCWRRGWEICISQLMVVTLVLVCISSIIVINDYFKTGINGTGGMSALIGAGAAWFGKTTKRTSVFKILPVTLLVNAGIIVMFLGLFVFADRVAIYLLDPTHQLISFIDHIIIAGVILFLAYLIPINKVSIHRYYRDRLMETFNPDVYKVLTTNKVSKAIKANQVRLHECKAKQKNTMPYHIINCNIILVESNIAKFKGRGGDNFILSPLYSGSNATGWRKTEDFSGGSMTLPTAVAISGAAANSDSGVAGTGLTIKPLVSAIMTIFNLRLGYWAVNPDPKIQKNQKSRPNFLSPGLWGVLGRSKINESSKFIQLSDGGHFENLAMYELLRRQCKLIICCDAEQDSQFSFGSLANVIEKSRVDFGVMINVSSKDLENIKYTETENGVIKYANKGYLVADITYPNNPHKGKLIYIKTTLLEDIPAELSSYKSTHKTFPDETTADQFFSEKQLEAYRVLGMHIADGMINDKVI